MIEDMLEDTRCAPYKLTSAKNHVKRIGAIVSGKFQHSPTDDMEPSIIRVWSGLRIYLTAASHQIFHYQANRCSNFFYKEKCIA